MVSGRLSLPPTSIASPPQRQGRPSQAADQLSDGLGGPQKFESHFAPSKQDLRPTAQKQRSQAGSDESVSSEPREPSPKPQATDSGSDPQASSTDESISKDDVGASDVVDAEHEPAPDPEASDERSSTTSDALPVKEATASKPAGAAQPAEASAADPADAIAPAEARPRDQARGSGQTEAKPRNGSRAADQKAPAPLPADGLKARGQTDSSSSSIEAAAQHATPKTPTKPERSATDAPTAESQPARSVDTDAPVSAEADAEGEAGEHSGQRRDSKDARPNSGRQDSDAVPARDAVQTAVEKPTFVNPGGEERAETRPQPAEHSAPRQNAAAVEALNGLKLDPASSTERLTTPSGTERGALQAKSEQQTLTAQSVARGMSAVLRQGGGSLTMKLSPASLGDVRIEMTMQAGRISVQFDVGTVAAYEAVKGQLSDLRQSLEQRGMTVERVETHISPALARSSQSDGSSNQRSGDQGGQNAADQQRHDATDGRSRGRADGESQHGGADSSAERLGAGSDPAGDFETALNFGLDAVA